MSNKASQQITIGVVIGLISAIGGKLLVDWIWSQPEPRLTASVHFGRVVLPPILPKMLEDLKTKIEKDAQSIGVAETELIDAIYSDELASKIYTAAITQEAETAKKQLGKHISAVLEAKLDIFRDCQIIKNTGLKYDSERTHDFYEIYRLMTDLSNYWEVEVKNNGTAQAEEISIDLPHTTYAIISRRSKNSEVRDVSDSLSLGSLGPQEKLKIIAWTPVEPYEYHAEKIIIRHNKGIGAVEVHIPTLAFWSKFGSFMNIMWLPLLITAFFSLLPICLAFRAIQLSKSPPQTSNIAKEPLVRTEDTGTKKNSSAGPNQGGRTKRP